MLPASFPTPSCSLNIPGKPARCVKPLLGASRRQIRRPCSTQVVCAEEKGDKELRKSLKKTQKYLKRSLDRIQQELGEDCGEDDEPLEMGEAPWGDVYAAHKTMYEREVMRWDQERKSWDEREQALLAEVQRLQGLVIELAAGGIQDAVDSQPDHIPEPEVTNLEPPTAIETVTEQSDESISTIAASMKSVFEAVDQGDVLSDEFTDIQKNLEKHYLENEGQEGVAVSDATQTSDPDVPVEVVKSPKEGPPPDLVEGDDDIYWVNRMQNALEMKGFYCGEQDCEDFFLGEGTTTALLAFQACEGLTETGMVDKETWIALLGDEVKDFYTEGTEATNTPENAGAAVVEGEDVDSTVVDPSVESVEEKNGSGLLDDWGENEVTESSGISITSKTVSVDPKLPTTKSGWPVLQESDGGKEVHALHVCLEKNGYHCGDDDIDWWYFGDRTVEALKTFQACCGLTQSGNCTEATWLALLGEDAKPSDLEGMTMDNSHDEDRAAHGDNTGGVWLLGEQRWENRS